MTDSSVEVLIAKQTIMEALYRYCKGLDRMDRAMVLSLWHDDGTADYGNYHRGTGQGFVEYVWPFHASLKTHSHQITNVLIDVNTDDGRAVSEAYVTVCLQSNPDAGLVTYIMSQGRYLDRWSRRGGMWAVDHRRFVEDVTVHQQLSVAAVERASGSGSRRDLDDPFYELFGPGSRVSPTPV